MMNCVNKKYDRFVSRSWNKIKKYIHDYEYIYTSPNKNKNVANFLPISRSYFKLKEILVDYDIYVKGYKIFVWVKHQVVLCTFM